MANISTFIIPVNVQAIRVLEEDLGNGVNIPSRFKGSTVNFSLLGSSNTFLGEQIYQDLPDSPSAMTMGLHLHWSLPDALTHGVHDPVSDSIVFPAVPNRWLLTRYLTPEPGYTLPDAKAQAQVAAHGVCVQQWVIESNRLFAASEMASLGGNMPTTIPLLVDNNEIFRSTNPVMLNPGLQNPPTLNNQLLGSIRVFDSSWTDNEASNPDAYDKDLNAISYYGPGFAAYYQNSAAVFGFSDDFKDIGIGRANLFGARFRVSYQVIGWFSEAGAADIAATLLDNAKAAYEKESDPPADKMAYLADYLAKSLKWTPSVGMDGQNGGNWPDGIQSLYNGIAADIAWIPGGDIGNQSFLPLPDTVFQNIKPELALGNNAAEAISALISKEQIVQPEGENDGQEPYPVVERQVELLFNAFQQDLLRRLAGSDPNASVGILEEYIHTRQFAARSGGSIWTVRPKGQNNDSGIGQDESPLQASDAELLSLLNATQQTYDRQLAALESRQSQAFLDWTRWGLTFVASSGSSDTADSERNYIESELLQIYTESGKTGYYSMDTREDGSTALNFTPVYTYVNTTAQGLATQLAITENTLRPAFVQPLAQLMDGILEAQAIYNNGNSKGALAQLQGFLASNNLGEQLAALQTQLADTSLADNLNAAVSTILPNELLQLQSALQDNTKGITNLINNFHQNGADPDALTNYINNWQSVFFNDSNLLDTQQIWLYFQAANYDGLTLQIAGAKLLATQNALQDCLNQGQNILLPALTAAYQSVNASLPALKQQVDNIVGQLSTLMQNLSSTNGSADFSPLLQSLTTALAPNNVNQTCAASLRKAWLQLIEGLPTGHQVVIMAGAFSDLVFKIGSDNIVQLGSADPYWLPNDPVVVITQPNDAPSPLLPVNRNGAATLVPFRQVADLIGTLTLNAGGNTVQVNAAQLSATAIPNLGNYAGLGTRSAVLQALLTETYFMLPQTAQDVLLNAAKLNAAELPALQDIQAQLSAKLLADQQEQVTPPVEQQLSFSSSKGSAPFSASYSGVAPYYIGLNTLGNDNPFLPLYLAWTADFDTIRLNAQDGLSVSGSFLSDNFLFDTDDVELTYHYDKPPFLHCSDGQRAPQQMSGQVTLSNRSADNLLNQIRVYLQSVLNVDIAKGPLNPAVFQNDFQRDLSTVYEHFRNTTILSQGLNGFNAGLQLQLALLQTPLNEIDNSDATMSPLFDFLKDSWKNPQWNKVTVGSGSTNAFMPLRAGRLRLRELFIVDTFGRYFSIGSNSAPVQQQLALSAGLSQISDHWLQSVCTGHNETQPNDAYLPPRILQPMRLGFNWLSASSDEGGENTFVERTKVPAFSPITGWILPNHLDDSLAIYDADGNALGSLGIEGAARQSTWRSVPSEQVQNPADNGRVQMGIDIAQANPFLQDFLNKFAFPEGGNPAFQDFLNALDLTQRYIHTSNLLEDKGLAILIGRPFVLVRAYLRLEMLGLPNVDLSAGTLSSLASGFSNSSTAWNDYDYTQRSSGGFNTLEVPVSLGDLYQFNDGLAGFFLGGDWSTFYTPVAKASSGAVQASKWGTIRLLPNADTAEPSLVPLPDKISAETPVSELVITLVMDPRAAVHASTGVLPVKSLRVPEAQYRPVLHKLMVNFLSSPVMVNKQNLTTGGQSFNVPLPPEKGYDWYWVQPGQEETALAPNEASDGARFPTTPNEMLDGWLKLMPQGD
ncbi:MAG: hypothetical protein J0L99_04515 [Chitinophagales bacterium]|nr:hypothetical protein [Chitinophagales bacterium]